MTQETLSLEEQRAELEAYFEPVTDAQRARIADVWAAALADPQEQLLKQVGNEIRRAKKLYRVHPATTLGYGMAWLEDMPDWKQYVLRNYFRGVVAVMALATPKLSQPRWARGVWLWETVWTQGTPAAPVPLRLWDLRGAELRTVGDARSDRHRWTTRELPPLPRDPLPPSISLEIALVEEFPKDFTTWPVYERTETSLELVDVSTAAMPTYRLRRLSPEVAIVPGAPRTGTEAMFFIAASACHACGVVGLTRTMSDHAAGRTTGQCAQCKAAREFLYLPIAADHAPPFHLGDGPTPSTVFSAAELRAIADAALAEVPGEPTAIATVAEYMAARRALVRGYSALVELAKFHPADPELATEVANTNARYDAYDAARRTVEGRTGAQPAPRGLDDRFRQHRGWLERGKIGDGRLVFAGETWRGIPMPYPRFVSAQVHDTTFEGIDFSHADFTGADVARSKFLDCRLGSLKMTGATLVQVDLRGSRLGLSEIYDSTITGGDWRGVFAGRAEWRAAFTDVDLRDADLSDGIYDRAEFVRCDLRGVDLRHVDLQLTQLGRAQHARFIDCDLRGAKLDRLRLSGTIFERCRLAGIEGTPRLSGAFELIDCDLSPEGDRTIGGAAQLAALWKARQKTL